MNSLINIQPNVLSELKDILSCSRNIVVTTHKNPDGDAIGSALGLCRYLKNAGHKAVVVTPNEYPDFLQWLPGNADVVVYSRNKTHANQLMKDSDYVFCVDFNRTERLMLMEDDFIKNKSKSVVIDHHPEPELFADFLISETSVSSTAELIFDFINYISNGSFIDKEVAECLYTGIMTDTGSFSYSCSNPNTFRVVSELMKFGIDKDAIHAGVYDNFSESRMRLMGYCLNEKMVVLKEYNTAYISITKEELKRFNFVMGDEEGLVNLPLSIKGIKFTGIFIEKADQVKISFRSRGHFAVNKFSAAYFEGGGHRNAAGGKSNISLDDTLKKFLDALCNYKDELR